MATPAASSSSKGWMSNIQAKAAQIFFILIVFQIPLFRYCDSDKSIWVWVCFGSVWCFSIWVLVGLGLLNLGLVGIMLLILGFAERLNLDIWFRLVDFTGVVV